MNIREIQDRLIGAESIMRELAEGRVGPPPLRAQQLPYVHTEADMRNWGHRRGEKRSTDPKADACRLHLEDDDAHSIYRREFWEKNDPGPSPEEVSRAIAEKEWVMLVDDDAERRALQAWVRAMAGGMTFTRWCKRIEKVSVMTGRRRKNRAVEKILAKVAVERDLHDENRQNRVLPVAPEISDISDTLTTAASGREKGLHSWEADDAFAPFVIDKTSVRNRVDLDISSFSWAAKRNEMRRQREARKRKREAA